MADLNARYGDQTELTAEVLERCGAHWEAERETWWFGSLLACYGIGELIERWTARDHEDDDVIYVKSPRTLGDLYRLADALGVTLREDGQ